MASKMSGPRTVQSLPRAQQLGEWPVIDEVILKTLPPVLRAVVRALGFARAKEWLDEVGGVNINIPVNTNRGLHLFSDELQRLRIVLVPHMDAAGRVWMPKVDKLFQLARNAQIRQQRYSSSIAALAHTYRLSSKQIINICCHDNNRQHDPELKKIMNICREGDDRQYDLF